ncbi:hypothetical protein BXY64_1644 [Marinifilum flexuosum]|uniref:Uncharacterized protein n=1 Tax=Marinifilum flexuosum TaxID=1117708 RepID=A0A419XA30_9BACT|nr:hypothetical protein BXY64_1644 [Marinifilum flexuosum]
MIQQPRFMTQKSVGMIQSVLVDNTEQDVYDTKSSGDDTATSVYDTEKCGDNTKMFVDDTKQDV